MKVKQIDTLIIVLLILMVISLNYSNIDSWLEGIVHEKEVVAVERIIDGDTIEVSNKTSVRLLGINTPERGEFLYDEAKEYLSGRILNRSVFMEYGAEKQDKYGRTLAYIFLENKNINAEIVEKGFANYYFYSGNEIYEKELLDAWSICLSNKINLCKPSDSICKSCIGINTNHVFNTCSFSCNITNWTIKGEGREKFIFNKTLNENEAAEFTLDLENSGGTIFLWDENHRLVAWKRS